MKISYRGILLILIAVGFIGFRFFNQNTIDLPQGGEKTTETIVIQDGEVLGTVEEVEALDKVSSVKTKEGEEEMKEPKQRTTKEIMVTDGVKHSIPLGDIQTLLGADGIPSIDDPKFVSTAKADEYLDEQEPGVAFSRGDTHRFYPYQILVWHEIVNDTIEGERVLITYCPLCLTGYVLDPLVAGERVEFGTSGKLWKSNLIMYDRKTESLWSQVLAEAIVGEMTGTMLTVLPSDQLRYGDWKKVHPDGEVLSRGTGLFSRYGNYPYAGGDYFGVDGLSLSLANPTDTRLPNNAFVFGVVVEGKAKAYDVEAVKGVGEVEDEFEGITFVLKHEKDLDVVRMFKKLDDGTLERVNPISGFWFSWAAAHPATELYK